MPGTRICDGVIEVLEVDEVVYPYSRICPRMVGIVSCDAAWVPSATVDELVGGLFKQLPSSASAACEHALVLILESGDLEVPDLVVRRDEADRTMLGGTEQVPSSSLLIPAPH